MVPLAPIQILKEKLKSKLDMARAMRQRAAKAAEASVVSGREQLDHGKGLDHFGIGPEFKCSLDCVDGRKFNVDVKMDVMDAHLSGEEKVYGSKNDPTQTCSNFERNQK